MLPLIVPPSALNTLALTNILMIEKLLKRDTETCENPHVGSIIIRIRVCSSTTV